MKRLAISSVLLTLVLTGCAVQRGMQANDAKTKLIGMTKHAFVGCAGEPFEMVSYGSRETLLYINSKDIEIGDGVADKVATEVRKTLEGAYCEVRIVITDGHVSSIRYSGQTGGPLTQGEACAPIIQGCL